MLYYLNEVKNDLNGVKNDIQGLKGDLQGVKEELIDVKENLCSLGKKVVGQNSYIIEKIGRHDMDIYLLKKAGSAC